MNKYRAIGLKAEARVKGLCLKQGHQLIGQNLKIMGIECDLIFKSREGEIWILEIKSLNRIDYFDRRVSPVQKKRIQTVLNYLLNKYHGSVIRAHLVTVCSRGIVQWYYDFFVN